MKDVWDVYDETGRAVAGGYPSRSAAWQGIAKDARHRFKFVKREAKLDSGNSDPPAYIRALSPPPSATVQPQPNALPRPEE